MTFETVRSEISRVVEVEIEGTSFTMRSILIFVLLCPSLHESSSKTFEQQCLEAHNKYRAMHGVPPLKLDSKLVAYAQNWANKLARKRKLEHRRTNYGESIYFVCNNPRVKAEAAVKKWYSEFKRYSFKKPGVNLHTYHFTQIVWRSSKKLGCAVARAGKGSYVVSNYYPSGNYPGLFPKNVFRRKQNQYKKEANTLKPDV